jgi:hypothetical protein
VAVTTETPAPRRTWLVIITAATTVLLLAGAALAARQLGWIGSIKDTPAATPSTSALSAETQLECGNVKHEYESWAKTSVRLDTMVVEYRAQDVVKFELSNLKGDGQALLKAVTGYTDQPSRQLAVAVATYNADLGFLALDYQLNDGKFAPENKDKAVRSSAAVTVSYRAFRQATCGDKA